MTKLVISWTGLINKLCRGTLEISDIEDDDVLFFFGCTASNIWGADQLLDGEITWYPNGITMYNKVLPVLNLAREEGRCACRELGHFNNFGHLNQFLIDNRRPFVTGISWGEDFNYPRCEELVAEQQLPYEVIWR